MLNKYNALLRFEAQVMRKNTGVRRLNRGILPSSAQRRPFAKCAAIKILGERKERGQHLGTETKLER